MYVSKNIVYIINREWKKIYICNFENAIKKIQKENLQKVL